MGKLVLFLADGSTKAIGLTKERVVIGRRADNDLCLPYPAVSGEHAAVVTILADSFLEDLGSTNGTLVNGSAVQKHFLRDRDQIDIGQQKLVYLADETAQVEVDNLHSVRKQLQAFGEPVEKAERRTRVSPSVSPDEQLPTQSARTRSRKRADVQVEAASSESVQKSGAQAANAAGARREPTLSREADVGAQRHEPDATLPADGATPLDVHFPAAPTRARSVRRQISAIVDAAAKEPPSERASLNRGLANMAKIRAGVSDDAASVGTVASPADDDEESAEKITDGANAFDLAVAQTHDHAETTAKDPAPEAGTPRMLPARITVLSGPSAGRSLIVERDEVVIGRVGLQVAAIDRGDGGFRLRLREGDSPLLLNGKPLSDAGKPPGDAESALKSGDIFEVAGTRLEFIVHK